MTMYKNIHLKLRWSLGRYTQNNHQTLKTLIYMQHHFIVFITLIIILDKSSRTHSQTKTSTFTQYNYKITIHSKSGSRFFYIHVFLPRRSIDRWRHAAEPLRGLIMTTGYLDLSSEIWFLKEGTKRGGAQCRERPEKASRHNWGLHKLCSFIIIRGLVVTALAAYSNWFICLKLLTAA